MFDIPRLAYWVDNALCLEWSGPQGVSSLVLSLLPQPANLSIHPSLQTLHCLVDSWDRPGYFPQYHQGLGRLPRFDLPWPAALGVGGIVQKGWRSVVECRLRQENSRLELPCFSSVAWASDHRNVCICILVEEDSREIVMTYHCHRPIPRRYTHHEPLSRA